MGVKSSKIGKVSETSSESSSEDEMTKEFSIPYDLLIDVLSFVPTEDLITHCRLVCRLWKDIIDGHSVWKIKCERENKLFPTLKLKEIPLHYYRLIYLHNPYGTNLINNPCGKNGLDEWSLVRNSGHGFAVEDPPNGSDGVPAEVGSTSCFATSFGPCEKFQMIDLVARGIHPHVLECHTTKIQVGEWYSARFDCACVYKLNVLLLDENYDKISDTLSFDDCTVKHFEFEHREQQWTGREWHKVIHTFEDVSKARYVFFQHFGKDSQFWAGHYGSKMTGAFVNVIA